MGTRGGEGRPQTLRGCNLVSELPQTVSETWSALCPLGFLRCKTRGLRSELLKLLFLQVWLLAASWGLRGPPTPARGPEGRQPAELSSWSPSPLEKQGYCICD